jgi:hypothetical protein
VLCFGTKYTGCGPVVGVMAFPINSVSHDVRLG